MSSSLGLVKELSGQGGSESSRIASTAASTNIAGDAEERSSRSGSDSRILDIVGSVSSPQDSTTGSRFEENFGTLVVDDGKSKFIVPHFSEYYFISRKSGELLPPTHLNRLNS
jgi:hypothetical protein